MGGSTIMADDRLVQRLEEQLRDAHATNADLREQLVEIKKRGAAANTLGLRGQEALEQLEKAHAKQKKAEVNAAAAQRKVSEAERELLRTRAELEELRERFDLVQLEAEELRELSARIESAKSAGDLFSA
jgi:flagellar biosynthesis chaperone FliJ